MSNTMTNFCSRATRLRSARHGRARRYAAARRSAVRPAGGRGARKPARRSRHSRQGATANAAGEICMKPAAARPVRCRLRCCNAPMSRWSISTKSRSAAMTMHTRPSWAMCRPGQFCAGHLRLRHLLQRDRASSRRRAELVGFCVSLKQGGLVLIGAPRSKVTVRRRHQIHAALVPRLVLLLCDRRQAGRPAWPRTVPDLLSPAGDVFEARSLRQDARSAGGLQKGIQESPRFPEMRMRQPLLAALLDTAASVMNFLQLGKADVRHGDYHVILQKR